MVDFSRLHSIDSEQSIIGGLLQNPLAADKLGSLRPEHCFDERHRVILAEIMSMLSAGVPVDVVTVAESLHDKGLLERVGELAYLGDLVANTPGSANIKRYAENVIGKALERQLLAASDVIREVVCGPGTTSEKIASSQSAVMGISEAVAARSPRTLKEVLVSACETLSERSCGSVVGLSSGYHDLDKRLLGGFRPGNLVILAGRPGMGKTAFAVNLALQAAMSGTTSLFLSLEMPEQELADRLISQVGSVNLSSVIEGDMAGESGDRIMSAVSRLSDLPMIIDDQGGLSFFDVASKARSVKRKSGLGFLVIDYLQLMSGEGDNRNQQIEKITRGLKSLAKELEIPILALSQLSRECEKRTNRRPMPSDLRESGAIEQDADVIMFVYRDEVYNENSPEKDTAEIIVSKNRQGQTGVVRLGYKGCYTRFDNLPSDWQPCAVSEERKYRRGME